MKSILCVPALCVSVALALSACQSMTTDHNTHIDKSMTKKDKADSSSGHPHQEDGQVKMTQDDKMHRQLKTQTKKGQYMATKSFDSKYDFNTTTTKITHALTEKGMTIFGVIDHQAAAAKAGLSMQPATVIIFGAPKIGTPLMIKDPKFALQLPLKALITEDDGKVIVVLNDVRHIIAHSDITWQDVENSLTKAEVLIENTVTK